VQRTTWLALVGTLLVTGVLLLLPKPSTGRAFTPRSPEEVLQKVSVRVARDAGLSEAEAADVAKGLIAESRRRGGDPRLLGQAQAVLGPWWNEPSPAAPVRLMRATIKQSLHDFDGALADLDVLAANPLDVQAQLTRATVLTVVGRYEDAEPQCLALRGRADDAVAAACFAPLLALRGRAPDAVKLLGAALLKEPKDSPLRSWLLSILGEVLTWSGKLDQAVLSLREALAADGSDTYSRLLLASTLTELARPWEAVALFADRQELNDAELLEAVLSARAAHTKDAAEREAVLAENVEASRRRGDVVHRREESRYALRIEGDIPHALALAVANIKVQKEPADVRVLLESALSAKDKAAAAPALEWMKKTGFADPRFVSLAGAVESLP
jgi:tetratricopeptide (TPR) repeat protein